MSFHLKCHVIWCWKGRSSFSDRHKHYSSIGGSLHAAYFCLKCYFAWKWKKFLTQNHHRTTFYTILSSFEPFPKVKKKVKKKGGMKWPPYTTHYHLHCDLFVNFKSFSDFFYSFCIFIILNLIKSSWKSGMTYRVTNKSQCKR